MDLTHIMNISSNAALVRSRIPRLRQEPVGLSLNVIRAHFHEESGTGPKGQNSQEWGGPFTILVMRHWPTLLAELPPELVKSPESISPENTVASFQDSYIRDAFVDFKDGGLPALQKTSEEWGKIRKQLVASYGTPAMRDVCDFGLTMSYFSAELEETLEEPIRDVLDHLLLSVYLDEDSPWRRASAVQWFAEGKGSDPLLLTRRVAAALDYSTDEFDHFLKWANANSAGRLPRWLEGNWLPRACCRWACRRLGAADADACLSYMTDVLPIKYPRPKYASDPTD